MVSKTNQLLKEFINLHPKYIDLSLNRLEYLLKKLGNPHINLPATIHIAGTNGKGSTLSFIKNILQKLFYRYLVDLCSNLFCENLANKDRFL